MHFIGNTCFRIKIVYHNKMHLHYPSLRKRLAPFSIKARTHVLKKVSATALDYAHVFLILTRVFSLQKSKLAFYDIINVIMYEITYFMLAFFLSSLRIEWTSRNHLSSSIRKYLHAFLQARFFSSTQLQHLLTFRQFIVKCCLGVT